MRSKLKKKMKYKTILYFAGRIIHVDIISFDILTKTSGRIYGTNCLNILRVNTKIKNNYKTIVSFNRIYLK